MFTVKQIDSLKAKEKPYQVREGKGFGIRVFPSGEKVWVYAYKFQGRQRMMTLGPYPEVKLGDAREKHAEARKQLKYGIDPLAAKQEERQEPTVKEAVEIYLIRAEKRGLRSIKEERRILAKYIPREWLHRKVKTVKRGEIRGTLEALAEDAPQMANQFLKTLHRFFNFCVDREFIEHNPSARMTRPAPETKKDRWLSEEEIRAFWKGVESASMSDETRRALKVVLITAQRPGEVVQMRYEHIQGRWWTIPGEHAKNGMAHRVFLSELALGIIGDGQGYVFPSPRFGGKNHLDRKSLSRAIEINEQFGLARWTPHDLRRTAASHMTSIGIPRLDVSKVLNHSEKSITAVYDRNSYDREKQVAMEAWSRNLESIITGKLSGKVVPIRQTAEGG